MVNIVFSNWFTFHGNQALAAFVNQHVTIIKLILFYHCLSQSGLSGHKLVVWFQVRCGCLWLTLPALLHSIKKTVRPHCLSSPPSQAVARPARWPGHGTPSPDCSLTPSNLAASPTPCIEYSEKNEERKCQRETGSGVEGAFNWIIPSAVITPIALKRPAIMEPCKRNFQRGGGLTILS